MAVVEQAGRLHSTAIAVAVVSVLLTGCSVLGVGGSVGANEWWLEGVSPDGRHVLVMSPFGGLASDCARWEQWRVEASAERVEVQAMLWEKHAPRGCTDDGASRTIEIALNEELAGRELVGCGYDDCLGAAFPGWLGGVGERLMATGDSVVVADGERLRVFDLDGELRWEQPAAAGWPEVTSRAVVTSDGGSSMVGWDLATGQRMWEVEELHPVASHTDLVVACGGQDDESIQALEADSGAVRWTLEVPCGTPAIVDGAVVMVANDREVDGRHELIVADVRTGELLRREPFQDGVDDRVAAYSSAVAHGDEVVVGGSQADLVVLDPSGTERLRLPLQGDPLGVATDVVVLHGPGGLTAIDLADGEVLWTGAHDPSVQAVLAGDALLELHRPSGELSRVDPGTGEPIWTTHVGRSAGLDAAGTRESLYVRTALAILAIDPDTGSIDWWQHVPPPVEDRHGIRPAD